MKVKICGITSVRDARAAANAGADMIGLNLVGGPRRIDAARAAEILTGTPPSVTIVALLTVRDDAVPDVEAELLRQFHITHIQLYGDVTPRTIARLRIDGWRPWFVQRVRQDAFPADTQAMLDHCATDPPHAIVLDAFDPARLGGTGQTVDWSAIGRVQDNGLLDGWPPLLLAGGLTCENVAEAVSVVRPWGVDVSSGVESAPGAKSVQKMEAFVHAARS